MRRAERGPAQRAACGWNLRQIGAGIRAFAADNRMRLPGNPVRPDGSVAGWNTSASWPAHVLPYVGDPKVFVSPGVEKVRVPRWGRYDDQLTPALPGCSYCLNGQASWRPISTIPQPSQMVVLWVLGATTISASRYPNTLSGNDWTAVNPTHVTNLP